MPTLDVKILSGRDLGQKFPATLKSELVLWNSASKIDLHLNQVSGFEFDSLTTSSIN